MTASPSTGPGNEQTAAVEPSRGARIARAERDAAHDLLRALRLAGHVPDGAWTRAVNGCVALESEGDIADAEARAMTLVWDIEQSDRIVGGPR